MYVCVYIHKYPFTFQKETLLTPIKFSDIDIYGTSEI